jgi:hypothetical protein
MRTTLLIASLLIASLLRACMQAAQAHAEVHILLLVETLLVSEALYISSVRPPILVAEGRMHESAFAQLCMFETSTSMTRRCFSISRQKLNVARTPCLAHVWESRGRAENETAEKSGVRRGN